MSCEVTICHVDIVTDELIASNCHIDTTGGDSAFTRAREALSAVLRSTFGEELVLKVLGEFSDATTMSGIFFYAAVSIEIYHETGNNVRNGFWIVETCAKITLSAGGVGHWTKMSHWTRQVPAVMVAFRFRRVWTADFASWLHLCCHLAVNFGDDDPMIPSWGGPNPWKLITDPYRSTSPGTTTAASTTKIRSDRPVGCWDLRRWIHDTDDSDHLKMNTILIPKECLGGCYRCLFQVVFDASMPVSFRPGTCQQLRLPAVVLWPQLPTQKQLAEALQLAICSVEGL